MDFQKERTSQLLFMENIAQNIRPMTYDANIAVCMRHLSEFRRNRGIFEHPVLRLSQERAFTIG